MYPSNLTGPRKPTRLNADITFLVDSSSSVRPLHYQKEKEFVKKLSKYLNIKPGASRAAFITFGSQSKTAFEYDDYQTLPQMEALIDGASYVGGNRRILPALEKASSVMAVSRPLVPRIVVIVTSGRPFIISGNEEKAVKSLHDAGVNTFVVVIGKDLDKNELLKVVSRPQNLIPIDTFNQLGSSAPSVANDISSSSGKMLN